MVEGLVVEHSIGVDDECIRGTDKKHRGFLVTFHEDLVIQCNHPQALNGYKPFI